jgi:hypothetical protein
MSVDWHHALLRFWLSRSSLEDAQTAVRSLPDLGGARYDLRHIQPMKFPEKGHICPRKADDMKVGRK